jgi:hypothetical protein
MKLKADICVVTINLNYTGTALILQQVWPSDTISAIN